jgi:hypothetical protein
VTGITAPGRECSLAPNAKIELEIELELEPTL